MSLLLKRKKVSSSLGKWFFLLLFRRLLKKKPKRHSFEIVICIPFSQKWYREGNSIWNLRYIQPTSVAKLSKIPHVVFLFSLNWSVHQKSAIFNLPHISMFMTSKYFDSKIITIHNISHDQATSFQVWCRFSC